MTEILLFHFHKYPAMQPEDAVKLCYQAVCGGGHMISDLQKAQEYLAEEREALTDSLHQPLTEAIGNQMTRLYLSSSACTDIPSDVICRLFAASADRMLMMQKDDKKASLEAAFSVLRTLTEAGAAPFSLSALDAYLAFYREAGYPIVRHSDVYRQTYAPHYRVMEEAAVRLIPAVEAIDRLLCRRSAAPILVAIDGPAAAGKSTAAAILAAVFFCNVFHMDDFFLPFSMRTRERLDSPGGNVHYERFRSEVLDKMHDGVIYRPYDCQTGDYGPAVSVSPKRLNLIEGSYAHHPYFGKDAYDLRVFLDVSPQEQRKRIEHRNPAMADAFLTRWIPMENRYFQTYSVREDADLLLS